ncbi:MAG TPA: hypothetical protein VMJ34_07750 [Bryobacteraceae bacterium]|nr:hypothetical protein [Bryobacteraceae bacterium]
MTHTKQLALVAAFLLAGTAGNAQSIRYPLNAASDVLPGLPNSGIAQGSVFAIYGSGLGPSTAVNALTFPLPKNLGGSTASVNVNGTALDCLLLYASDRQVTALLPSATPLGTGTITVQYAGGSASSPITVTDHTFGTFAWNQQGSGTGVIAYPDFSLVTPTKAANPGETLIIWGTGLGAVVGDEAAGPLPGNLGLPVEVWVGNQQSPSVGYAGRSGCCSGIDQVVFDVPQGIAGCNVSVAVKINGEVSNFTSMAIAATGRVCSDEGFPTGTDISTWFNSGTFRYGGITLTRSINETAGILGLPGTTTKSDDGSGIFAKITIPPGQSPSGLIDSSSYGSCTLITFSGQGPEQFVGLTYNSLDAGPSIGISGPSGNRTLSPLSAAGFTIYSGNLGDTTPGNYLDPGTYTISGTGGTDVGAFNVQIAVPPAVTWTNEDSITTVTRANGQLITWSGGDPSGYVDISGDSIVLESDNSAVGATFYCRAKVSDHSFMIPPVVLLSLPASASVAGFVVPGGLSVSAATLPKQFSATGLDLGFANSLLTNSKQVITYQ